MKGSIRSASKRPHKAAARHVIPPPLAWMKKAWFWKIKGLDKKILRIYT